MRIEKGSVPMALRRSALAFAALAAFCGAAQAQSFSADVLTFNAGAQKAGTGRVHTSAEKVRIETPDLPDGFFVDNSARKTAYYVKPIQYIYMEAKQSSQLTQLLIPLDPEYPCEQWQAMSKVAEVPDYQNWTCTRLGEETINNHLTLLYRVVSPRGISSLAWIDTRLKFLVKYRNEDASGFDVANIDEGPQDPALFKVPNTFEKFDPKELIARIKDSDVWVEPPK